MAMKVYHTSVLCDQSKWDAVYVVAKSKSAAQRLSGWGRISFADYFAEQEVVPAGIDKTVEGVWGRPKLIGPKWWEGESHPVFRIYE